MLPLLNTSAYQVRGPSKQRAARCKVQQTASCASEYWQQLSDDIQSASAMSNTRGMYEGIKEALGPTQCKAAPLSGKVITDKGKQMER